MKNINYLLTFISIFLISITSFNGLNAQINNTEKESLVYMYEEEKLAHDVYLTLSEKYSIPVFKNITKSEAYHMNMVLDLIKKYELKDPSGKEIGVFEDKKLQKLYDDLIEKGSKSLIDALLVGATIEDIDIFDLENYKEQVKSEDISKLYKQLICGSENHMRAFTRHLKIRDKIYKPKNISETRYEEIINGKHNKCFEIK